MKDKNLKVIYRRGEGGELYVFLYRSNFHIATIQVNSLNGIDVYRGKNNKSKIRLHETPTA
jgi:hypothetical protein